MALIVILILLEILTIPVLKGYFFNSSRRLFYVSLVAHFMVSVWLWYVIIASLSFSDPFDTPSNIWMHLNMSGMIVATGISRFMLCLFHYTGKLIRIRKRGYIRGLTLAGFIISGTIIFIIAAGAFIGKFNFRTEEVTIKIENLNEALDNLRIVQISDLHLAGFYRHRKKIAAVVDEINSLKPDLIVNTGDFISYGWREFDGFDTILSKAESRYGNFAILGNHDMGTYYPGSSQEGRRAIALKVNELAEASGYTVLNDESVIIDIKGSQVALIGVETYGRHPDIIHGNLQKAAAGTDSAGFKILLAHDPNQWKKDVAGKTGIDLTLSGHTHGMQIGIVTKKFRWSPSKYFYPEWHGLFSEGSQHLYVNRGLGVMGVPFRIWMPPEITVITLVAE
jgi:hypothetical protein